MAPSSTLSDETRVNRLVRLLTLVWLNLKKPFLARRIRRPVLEWIDNTPFLVLPQVLNPVVFRSGEFFARSLSELIPSEPEKTFRTLDMGCGCGVAGIFAARRGHAVVAVDINGEAVRCARINALLNDLEDRVEVRHGDLFAPLRPGELFDLVLFNPPFFRGRPRSQFDEAWHSVDVPERFAEGLSHVLRPGGAVLVLLSTDGDADGVLRALKGAGMESTAVARRDFGNEIMTIYRAVPKADIEATTA